MNTNRRCELRRCIALTILVVTWVAGCDRMPDEVSPPPIDVRIDLHDRLEYVPDPEINKLTDEPPPIRQHVAGSPVKGRYQSPPAGSGLRRHMSVEQTQALLGRPTFVLGDNQPQQGGNTDLFWHVYDQWGLKLTFHSHRGLGAVEISKRWPEAIAGARVGDPWDDFLRANNLFDASDQATGASAGTGTANDKRAAHHGPRPYRSFERHPDYPGWAVARGSNGRVSIISYTDGEVIGTWVVDWSRSN